VGFQCRRAQDNSLQLEGLILSIGR
jgi:hypothetical protein